MTPISAAAYTLAVLLAFTRSAEALKGLWGFLPTKWQWLPGVAIYAASELQQKLVNGVQTWLDLAVPVLAAAGLVASGIMTASHKATLELVNALAQEAVDPLAAQRKIKLAQRGSRVKVPLVAMLALLVPIACTPAQVATIQSVVSKAVLAAVQSGVVLDLIESKALPLLAATPNADLEKKVRQGIADTRLAITAVLAASEGTAAASTLELDAALGHFRTAWQALQPLLIELGIVQKDGSFGVSPGSTPIPEPLLLKLRES